MTNEPILATLEEIDREIALRQEWAAEAEALILGTAGDHDTIR